MNKNITSKEEILNISRELIKKKGFNSINIRTIAERCILLYYLEKIKPRLLV